MKNITLLFGALTVLLLVANSAVIPFDNKAI